MSVKSKEVHLAERPHGEPGTRNFAFREVDVPSPGSGQVLVRNHFMSVDPYMRGRMNEGESYIPPFGLDEPMTGTATGEVVESNTSEVPVGTIVRHFQGWREYALVDATAVETIDPNLAPESSYLGVLGLTGLTAYVALKEIAGVRDGDVVFISGAAGAVGSVSAGIARALGASRVVGSAGGEEKVRRLTEEFGYDAGFDYRAGDVSGQLRDVAPDGIDVYLDNVGGEHLEAAIARMRFHGRIAAVGAISQYNATEPAPGPRNLVKVVSHSLTMRGFTVGNYQHLGGEFAPFAAKLLREEAIPNRETIVEGIDNAVEAFLSMMRGGNTGKMIVKL
ncbi:zinc-binding dehydrogenase [Haloglycomyces albus]|uniref:zinc-binding dehydrogenase n=1 Tax=Haloglycomyces albus TaxID=526067 RepID=UPI00046D1A9D